MRKSVGVSGKMNLIIKTNETFMQLWAFSLSNLRCKEPNATSGIVYVFTSTYKVD